MLEEHEFVYKTGNPKTYYDILFKTRHMHVKLEKAAENNYMDLVNFLLNSSPASLRSINISSIMGGAALNNHIDMIQHFLKEANVSVLTQGLLRSIQGGHNDLAIFFVENGAANFHAAIKIAKLYNNQFMIDYLRKRM